MEGVAIKVLPRSSRNQVLGVAKRDVCLLRGDTSRQKLISVAGFNAPALRAELLRHGSPAAAADPD